MKILLVEDSPFIGQAMAELLGGIPDMQLAGHVQTFDDAVEFVQHQLPDMAIIDLRIPRQANTPPDAQIGLEMLAMLRSMVPDLPVVIFSSLPEVSWLRRVAQEGAVGFLSKDESSEAIQSALQAVAQGLSAFTVRQMRILQQRTVTISERELDVLRLLDRGMSNQEIAQQLRISSGTVRKHVERLREAFAAHTRGQVVALARQYGLLT